MSAERAHEIDKAVAPGITRLCYETGEIDYGDPNFYLVGETNLVVVDTGWGDTGEVELFNKSWERRGKPPVAAIVLSHGHFDHDGGANEISELTGAPIIGGDEEEAKETVIELDGRTLTIFPSPGHSKDSLCVLDSQTHGLFTGDTITAAKSVIVPDIPKYLQSLSKIKSINPSMILPGHGKPVNNAARKIEDYIQRVKHRESMILHLLKRGATNAEGLANRMYPRDVMIGQRQIEAHLRDLEERGVVLKDGVELHLA